MDDLDDSKTETTRKENQDQIPLIETKKDLIVMITDEMIPTLEK